MHNKHIFRNTFTVTILILGMPGIQMVALCFTNKHVRKKLRENSIALERIPIEWVKTALRFGGKWRDIKN